MSIPKFTAESSLGNYGVYSLFSKKYEIGYYNSRIIEPAMPPIPPIGGGDYECETNRCRTERCKVSCYIDGVSKLCDGTREVCEYDCYRVYDDGTRRGPYDGGARSETGCIIS